MDKERYIRAKVNNLWNKLYNYANLREEYDCLLGELAELDGKLEDMQHASGINLSGTHVQNHVSQASILNDLFSQQQAVERDVYLAQAKMREILTIVNLIEDEEVRKMTRERFVNGVSWSDLSDRCGYDRSVIHRRIKKELSKLINL